MTLCDKCGRESGNLFCGKCREEVAGSREKTNTSNLIPLLYWDKERKMYLFACSVKFCPCNVDGTYCSSWIPNLENAKFIMHEYDGDNICKQFCG